MIEVNFLGTEKHRTPEQSQEIKNYK